MYQLKIIIASTRENRKGPAIANWVLQEAKKHPEFETELLDLREINLPFLNEPEHPSLRKYTQQSTKDWSAIIDPADAFIIVTPEYNHGYPAPLKNALDTIYQEWNHKPVAFVSYGGMAGGTRAVQLVLPVTLALKMTPLSETVHIPFFTKMIDKSGTFQPNEPLEKSSAKMFKALIKWGRILKQIRADEAG